MSKERRNEWIVIGVTALVLGAVTFLVDPFPPLLDACNDSQGWARGIQLVVMNFVAWMMLGLLGVLPMNIGVGMDGIVGERREIEQQREKAAEDVDAAIADMASKLERAIDVCEDLVKQQEELDDRVAALEMPVSGAPEKGPGVGDV